MEFQPRSSHEEASTSRTSFDADPKFYLFLQNDRVEGHLAPFPTVIDFSLPNTRILQAEFVCLRKLPRPKFPDSEEKTPTSSMRSLISTVFRRASKKSAQASPVIQNFWRPHEPSGRSPRAQSNEEMYAMTNDWLASHEIGSRNPTNDGLQLYELIWKEAGPSGQIKRIKFESNLSGYNLISTKLDNWAVAAHSSALEMDPSELLLSIMNNTHPKSPTTGAPNFLGTSRKSSPTTSNGGSYLSGNSESSSPVHQESKLASENQNSKNSQTSAMSPKGKKKSNASKESKKEPMGTLPGSRARLDAAKAAAEILTPDKPAEPLPDNAIAWGSVVIEGKFLPPTDSESCVLRKGHFQALAAALPPRHRTSSWTLLYSSSRDGISLKTLYRKVVKSGPLLLLVKDTKNHIFGGYCSEEWKAMPRYYGNGECFVFQVQPECRAFRWTRGNSYFMFSTPSVLAMGGGTHYSLLLNSDLLTGYSGECETFGNCTLSGSEEFNVSKVEVWGFK